MLPRKHCKVHPPHLRALLNCCLCDSILIGSGKPCKDSFCKSQECRDPWWLSNPRTLKGGRATSIAIRLKTSLQNRPRRLVIRPWWLMVTHGDLKWWVMAAMAGVSRWTTRGGILNCGQELCPCEPESVAKALWQPREGDAGETHPILGSYQNLGETWRPKFCRPDGMR